MRPSARFFVSSRRLIRNSAVATVVIRERRTRNHWRRPLEEVPQSSRRHDGFAQEPPEEPKHQPVVRAATQQDRARSRALAAHDHHGIIAGKTDGKHRARGQLARQPAPRRSADARTNLAHRRPSSTRSRSGGTMISVRALAARRDRGPKLPEHALRIAEDEDQKRSVLNRRRDRALPITVGSDSRATRRAVAAVPRPADRHHRADSIEFGRHEVLERWRTTEAHPAGLEKVVAELPQNQNRARSVAIA